MKKSKKLLIILLSFFILILILFTPIVKTVELSDGTAKTYTSLTYRIIKWNMYEYSEKPYCETEIEFIPNNFKSVETIWNDEKYIDLRDKGYGSVSGQYIVTEKAEGSIIVDELTNISSHQQSHILISQETFNKVSSGITFDELDINTTLIITTDGYVRESYPATFGKIYKIMPMEIETN